MADQTWYDAEACIEAVYPLQQSLSSEIEPDWLEDFCDDMDCASATAAKQIHWLKPLIDEAEELNKDVAPQDVLDVALDRRLTGVLVKVRWCKRQYGANGIYSSGPGVTTWRWVYGPDLETTIDAALQIVADHHDAAEKAGA